MFFNFRFKGTLATLNKTDQVMSKPTWSRCLLFFLQFKSFYDHWKLITFLLPSNVASCQFSMAYSMHTIPYPAILDFMAVFNDIFSACLTIPCHTTPYHAILRAYGSFEWGTLCSSRHVLTHLLGEGRWMEFKAPSSLKQKVEKARQLCKKVVLEQQSINISIFWLPSNIWKGPLVRIVKHLQVTGSSWPFVPLDPSGHRACSADGWGLSARIYVGRCNAYM